MCSLSIGIDPIENVRSTLAISQPGRQDGKEERNEVMGERQAGIDRSSVDDHHHQIGRCGTFE